MKLNRKTNPAKMKMFLSASLLILIQSAVFGQTNDTWTSFWNKDTTLLGYTDKNGLVKIAPKFESGFTGAQRFDHIIAAAEKVDKHLEFYYLTKGGRSVGRDSLHMFDNGSDCENEGFIRFRDYKTDKAGLFNRNGGIAVPAEYNDITRVRNGMLVALKGAEKKYWEGGEHFSWIGGQEMLIDTANNILIDSFRYKGNINFFSLSITPLPHPDSVRQNFKTNKGQYFSFVDLDKEFTAWLKTFLANGITKENLMNASFIEISFWDDSIGWKSEKKEHIIEADFELISTKLLQLKNPSVDYNIFSEGLNSYIYESALYRTYFNNCGEPKDWIYPVENIVFNYGDIKHRTQDSVEFLRTENGYKLISISIKAGGPK